MKKKIQTALNEALETIDRLITPDKCSLAEAVEVMEAVETHVQQSLECLRMDLKKEEG